VWFSSTITNTLAGPGPLGVEAEVLVVVVGRGGVDDEDDGVGVGVGGGVVNEGVVVGEGIVGDGPVVVATDGWVPAPRSSRGAVMDSCESNLAPSCTPVSPME